MVYCKICKKTNHYANDCYFNNNKTVTQGKQPKWCKFCEKKVFHSQFKCFNNPKNCESDSESESNSVSNQEYYGGSYTGNEVNDKPHGFGTFTYNNGSSYRGQFLNGNPQGKGTYIKCGEKFKGFWENSALFENNGFTQTPGVGYKR